MSSGFQKILTFLLPLPTSHTKLQLDQRHVAPHTLHVASAPVDPPSPRRWHTSPLLCSLGNPSTLASEISPHIMGNSLRSGSPASMRTPCRQGRVLALSVCQAPSQLLACASCSVKGGWTELNWLSELATLLLILRTLHIWPTSNLPATVSSKAGTFLPDESLLAHCHTLSF